MTTFTPLYSINEMAHLFKLWADGSLDGIHSRGCAIVGITDCEMGNRGLRLQSLAERVNSTEMTKVLESMAKEVEPMPTYAALLVLKHLRQQPMEDLARAFEFRDSTDAQSWLVRSQDEFMRRLLRG